MLKIRLSKLGKKGHPSYRIVVADARSSRDGAVKDAVGFFNPGEGKFQLDKEKFESWVKKGAQPTQAVLLLQQGKYKFFQYIPGVRKEKADEKTS